jgi:hypothetical protein
MQTSDEKFLKAREHLIVDVFQHRAHYGADMFSLCGSLIERYERQDLQLHWHLYADAKRTVDNGKRTDLCIVLNFVEVGLEPRLSINDPTLRAIGSESTMYSGEQHPPVLVDVAKVVNDPQHRLLKIPTVVRLQTLDECNRIWGHPKKPSLLGNCVLESLWRRTDGEHIVFVGSVLRSKHEFPHQVIEGRSEVLEEISKYHREPSGDGTFGNNPSNILIRGAFALSDYFCWVRLVILRRLGLERLEMFVSPDDFVSNGIGERHSLV